MNKIITAVAAILGLIPAAAAAAPCEGKITDDPNWRNVVAEAVLAADEWAATKEPRVMFIGPKGPGEATPTYQVAGQYKGKYLIFITFKDSAGNTSFASLLPNFPLCPIPEEFYKGKKPFTITMVKFNGRVIK